ncbi:MAG: hypothetical protein KGQ41_06195, partial [Alphaproteobacteria bacterium]|nr:hypothetical protein [Alphaproteobacteria bacterium]
IARITKRSISDSLLINDRLRVFADKNARKNLYATMLVGAGFSLAARLLLGSGLGVSGQMFGVSSVEDAIKAGEAHRNALLFDTKNTFNRAGTAPLPLLGDTRIADLLPEGTFTDPLLTELFTNNSAFKDFIRLLGTMVDQGKIDALNEALAKGDASSLDAVHSMLREAEFRSTAAQRPQIKAAADAILTALDGQQAKYGPQIASIEELQSRIGRTIANHTLIEKQRLAIIEARQKLALDVAALQGHTASSRTIASIEKFAQSLQGQQKENLLAQLAILKGSNPLDAAAAARSIITDLATPANRQYALASTLQTELTQLGTRFQTRNIASAYNDLVNIRTTDPVASAIADATTVKGKFAAFLTTNPEAAKIVDNLTRLRGSMDAQARAAFDAQLAQAKLGNPTAVLGLLDMYSEWMDFRGGRSATLGEPPRGLRGLGARRALAASARTQMVQYLEHEINDDKQAKHALREAGRDRSPTPAEMTARKAAAHVAAVRALPEYSPVDTGRGFLNQGYRIRQEGGRLFVSETVIPRTPRAPNFLENPLGSIAHEFDTAGRNIQEFFEGKPQGPRMVEITDLKAGTPPAIRTALGRAIPVLLAGGMTPQGLNDFITQLNGGPRRVPTMARLFVATEQSLAGDNRFSDIQKRNFLAALREATGLKEADIRPRPALRPR